MRNRCGQINMAHTLTAHLGNGNLNAAFLTHNAFIFHALIFAAQTFIVFYRAKNSRAEQTITLRLESPVIDGFRLFNLAKGPATDFFRAG